MGSNAPRRFLVIGIVATVLVFILFISSFRPEHRVEPKIPAAAAGQTVSYNEPGKAIAPKLGNETIKYVYPMAIAITKHC